MRLYISHVVGGALLLAGVLSAQTSRDAVAEVRVNVNLGPPPVIVREPPVVVMVPGSQVYFIPQISFDLFFYDGYWWSPRGDRWYRSRAYNGPWRVVSRRAIPGPVYRVPRDYRRVYVRENRIPYRQWKREGRGHDRGRRGDRGGHRGRDDHRGR